MRNKTTKILKRIIIATPIGHKVAKKVKRIIVDKLEFDKSQREIYDHHYFYPSINDYYNQQQQTARPQPLISILLPTYNTPEIYLRECIESIITQSYTNWELCIADDKSPDSNVVKVINEYQKKDGRIKFIQRESNGHISAATNSALSIAKGEFVALMDHDDILWPNALYELVTVIRKHKDVDLIYSDEDKLDSTGKIHSYPFLKPDFSPEFLESCNYITHFSCIRTSIMNDIGGFKIGVEGAQDWDLFVRISLKTKKIIHLPKILYSWRIHESSTASDTDAKPYVYEAQRKLLEDYLRASDLSGDIETGIIHQHRTIKYHVAKQSRLSVVVHYTTQSRVRRLLESISKNSPGVDYDLQYLIQDTNSRFGIEVIHKELLPHIKANFIVSESSLTISKLSDMSESTNILYIEDQVSFTGKAWGRYFVAEISRKGVGYVGPVIFKNGGNQILSAGLGIGYGSGGYLNMLENISFEDAHYTRGLYAKSRRNVTALSPLVFAFNKDCIKKVKTNLSVTSFVESMIHTADTDGLRNIYTPYIQVLAENNSEDTIDEAYKNYEDRFLNPNFNKDNPNMEVVH